VREPLAYLVLAVLAVPHAVTAQALRPGVWRGSVTSFTPDSITKADSFVVARTGDSVSVTMTEVPDGDPIPLHNLRQVGDTLHFTWTTEGRPVLMTCSLLKQPDGSYLGDCEAAVPGSLRRVRMIPPR